jgi:ATP-dependent exoDNAse (exonuclease V) beta subunit
VVMNSNKNFLVYKSSAGSGKTYTLVKEYLTIALSDKSPERYKNILAITFTNKAAAEMKDRVTFYLKSFCQQNYYKTAKG